MSTEKTLATVKHGGFVQLAASERARFEAWCPYDLEKNENGIYLWDRTRIAWGAWQTAISKSNSDK